MYGKQDNKKHKQPNKFSREIFYDSYAQGNS